MMCPSRRLGWRGCSISNLWCVRCPILPFRKPAIRRYLHAKNVPIACNLKCMTSWEFSKLIYTRKKVVGVHLSRYIFVFFTAKHLLFNVCWTIKFNVKSNISFVSIWSFSSELNLWQVKTKPIFARQLLTNCLQLEKPLNVQGEAK